MNLTEGKFLSPELAIAACKNFSRLSEATQIRVARSIQHYLNPANINAEITMTKTKEVAE